MLGWIERNTPMKAKLGLGLGALVASPAAMLWLSYQGQMSLAAGAGALAGSLAVAGWVFGAIAGPHGRLLERLEGLAAGDLASSTPHTDRRDCVGRMARAMETCRQHRRHDDDARRAAEDERRMVMASLAEGLTALSLAKRGVEPKAMPAALRPVRTEPVLVVDNSVPWEDERRGEHWGEDLGEIRGLLERLGQDRRQALR